MMTKVILLFIFAFVGSTNAQSSMPYQLREGTDYDWISTGRCTTAMSRSDCEHLAGRYALTETMLEKDLANVPHGCYMHVSALTVNLNTNKGQECSGDLRCYCQRETCRDGTQNQDETGIDCGGDKCNPCETCSDGIQNQNETGIDCGGDKCNPCEHARVLIVGGEDESVNTGTHTCELVSVTKNNITGDFNMDSHSIQQVPASANSYYLDDTYLVKMGTTNNFFLKVYDKGYSYNTDNSAWTQIPHSGATTTAKLIPALNWAKGFLTFGSYSPTTSDMVYFTDQFISTKVGAFNDIYQPMYRHKVVKTSPTSFIVVGGYDYTYKTMRGAKSGTLTSGGKVTWTQLQPMDSPRELHCLFVLGTKVVVVGGVTIGGTPLRSVEYLDLSSSTPLASQAWKSGPTLPQTLYGHTCDVTNGGTFVVLVGGMYGGVKSDKVLVMNEDLEVKELSQRLSRKRYRHSSNALDKDKYHEK